MLQTLNHDPNLYFLIPAVQIPGCIYSSTSHFQVNFSLQKAQGQNMVSTIHHHMPLEKIPPGWRLL